eukprot:gene2325-3600_t
MSDDDAKTSTRSGSEEPPIPSSDEEEEDEAKQETGNTNDTSTSGAGEEEEEAKADTANPAARNNSSNNNGRSEISHSPLRKVKDVRSRFENPEAHAEQPVEKSVAKPAAAPKAKDGKFSYEDLRVPSSVGKDQIDISKREDYLSSAEFEKVFGMNEGEFQKLPKW